jgi:phosphoglycolate phosphatase
VAELRAVVFDLDGTLIDSRLDIAEATNHVLVSSGRSPLDVAEISSYVGDGAKALLARAARIPEDAAEMTALLDAFLDYYAAHATVHTRLLDGAGEVLARLGAELPLALCTNKPRRTTDAVLAGLALTEVFTVVIAGDDLPRKKPHPLPIQTIAERLGAPASMLVMVGDGPQDVECGRAAGARTVGVEGGIQPRERLLAAEPDVVIGSLFELLPLVARWRAVPT